jgi:hypothetical protein
VIVYGDAEVESTVEAMLESVATRVRATDPASLDDLRTLLVQAGQLEQALADDSDAQDAIRAAEQLTDAIAEAFVRRFSGANASSDYRLIENALAQLRPGRAELRVRIPEGFEFYTLFPEQYCVTAQRWAEEHAISDVLVVGIRSIGTTISAVVRATLVQRGFQVSRLTVRPTGHPFERSVELPFDLRCSAAIVVDEGPGLSGSSMTCVAEALNGRAITFFPGHENGPGPQASSMVRERWAKVRRYFTPLDDVRWSGRSLRDELSRRTEEVLGSAATEIEDLGAGAWREHAYADRAQWPAVAAAFELSKFKVTTHSGAALLWKFMGFGSFGAVPITEQLDRRARLGWTPAPLAACRGFTATRWIEGERLTCDDATPAVIDEIARYIADTAGLPLTVQEIEAATRRLNHMLRNNSQELGLAADIPAVAVHEGLPGYGDGRMAPHEWIWTNEGRLLKTDAHDHSCDHTIAGRQPFLWDVAGVIAEWKLDSEQQTMFLSALEELGLTVRREALEFYLRAYAVFRAGLMAFAMESASPDEAQRLRAAADRYASFKPSRRRELAAT